MRIEVAVWSGFSGQVTDSNTGSRNPSGNWYAGDSEINQGINSGKTKSQVRICLEGKG